MRALILAALLAASPARAALYDDLGGRPSIERITSGLLRRSYTDPRIASTFDEADRERLHVLLVAYLCQVSDGPCRYPGRSMHAAHKGLGLRPRHMNALVENLQDAMDEAGVPFATQNRLLARLAPSSTEIIE